jgi:hypothetical protein
VVGAGAAGVGSGAGSAGLASVDSTAVAAGVGSTGAINDTQYLKLFYSL